MGPIITKSTRNYTSVKKSALFCLSLILLLGQNSRAIVKSQLGISLCAFSATVSEDRIRLHWATLQENDNKLFMIERSNNAIDFVLIDTLSGKGTTSQRNDYCLYDKNPVVGISYYRITQVDNSSCESKSDIVSVEYVPKSILCEGISKAQAYPVPFDNSFSININCIEDLKLTIEIRNETGKMVFNAEKNCFQGPNSFTYDEFTHLQSGVYFVLISDQRGCDMLFTQIKGKD